MARTVRELTPDKTFICRHHNGYFSMDHFYFNKRGDYRCKEAQLKNVSEGQKKRDRYWVRIKYNYKLTQQDCKTLWITQDKACAICKKPYEIRRLHVDHDHLCCITNKATCGACIRGLLCQKCNFLLGNAEDNIDILSNAIDYLSIWNGRQNNE